MQHLLRPIALLVFLAAGCQPAHDISMAIGEQFHASGGASVNLDSAATGEWERVCIAGPYTSDAFIAQTLGFPWSARGRSTIASSDSVALLLFVRQRTVVSWVEHPRGSGDFSSLSGRCFERSRAKFRQVNHPAKGYAGLFPSNEA